MNSQSLNNLKYQIENLEKIHHPKILQIIKNNEIKFSENRNGIFINMNSFNEKTINEINKMVLYIKEQEQNLKDTENLKKTLNKDYFETNSSNKLKDNTLVNLNAV
tara:strand:+ start:685 stop:1002 length:318 start_codon:yes stop_codon:yes gene_type:complete